MPSSTCRTNSRICHRSKPFAARRPDQAHEYTSIRGRAALRQTPTCFWKRMIAANSSTTRLAPPTRAPSTSGSRMKLAMFADFTDPP